MEGRRRFFGQFERAIVAIILITAVAACGGDGGGGGNTNTAIGPLPPPSATPTVTPTATIAATPTGTPTSTATATPTATPTPIAGSCLPASSLAVLVTGSDAVAYVPKGSWSNPKTGVSIVNVEGASVTPGPLSGVTDAINSCASNPASTPPLTVCTANNNDVWLIPAGSNPTVTSMQSAATGTIIFTSGSCANCSVAMDAVHNKAVIGLSLGGAGGFQMLDLGGTPAFETAFISPGAPSEFGTTISPDPLIDPARNLLLSAGESGDYQIVDVTTATPQFYQNGAAGELLESTGEDCMTGIAVAPTEIQDPANIFITDLTQIALTAGVPSGTWSAPWQNQSLSEAPLAAGADRVAIAPGTHTGVVAGEYGGHLITAITLPATSGSGTPAIADWVTCNFGNVLGHGIFFRSVTAYQSPNNGDAIAVVTNEAETMLAAIDLTAMLNPTTVPRTSGPGLGHACSAGTLPSALVSVIPVP